MCVSNEPINKSIQGKSQGGLFIQQDTRGRFPSINKISKENIDFIKLHIESFPVVESLL